MKLTRDIQSLSTFKRDTAKVVRQLKKTGQPVVLTVNGKAELVVQDAESYQKLLEVKDRMEAIEGIKRGLESMDHCVYLIGFLFEVSNIRLQLLLRHSMQI